MITNLLKGYAHPTADPPSYGCVKVTGTPGATVSVTATTTNGAFGLAPTPADPTPERPKTDSQTVTLPPDPDPSGMSMTTVMFKIWQLGDYAFSVTASNAGGTSATETTTPITVPAGPAGTVVGPPDCGTPAA